MTSRMTLETLKTLPPLTRDVLRTVDSATPTS